MAKHPCLIFSRMDTTLSSGHKALMIRKKFGLIGHVMIYEVISWISAGEGWFAKWNDETADDFATTRMFDLSLSDKVKEVLEYMVEVGFFSQEAFTRHRVLTSKKIYEYWEDAKTKNAKKKKDEILENYIPEGSFEEEIRNTLFEAGGGYPRQNEENPRQNEKNPREIAEKPRVFLQRKEKKIIKQTNKQKKAADVSAEVPPQAAVTQAESPPDLVESPPGRVNSAPDPVPKARENPRWPEVRLRIARILYEPGLSGDLVDHYTAAALNGWILVEQVGEWKRKARAERELYERSNGRAGKAKLWEVLRPPLEAVYAANGLDLPACDPKRREPPPPPKDLQGLSPELAAARSVKI